MTRVLGSWLQPRFDSRGGVGTISALAALKTWADIIETIVTPLAVIVGALWAYFKFARGRIFRPRIGIDMSAQWVDVDEVSWFQVRVRVKNIGASKISLEQKGTGLRVSIFSPAQHAAPATASWNRIKTCPILEAHSWVESGETVSDDLLINLGVAPCPVFLESRFVLSRRFLKNIAVSARQIIPRNSTISDSGN
jgi:hypothetical protein